MRCRPGMDFLAVLLAVVLLAVAAGPPRPARAQAVPSTESMDAVAVVERVRSAVVTVVNERTEPEPFVEDRPRKVSRGTGFIVDDQGHVVTNEHVARHGDRIAVILADGERRPAHLVGADRLSDLAVVRIDGDLPATLGFGDSDALRVGQPVLAIGSPLGAFPNTVTGGIVGALNRDFPGKVRRGAAIYSDLVQHDAPINPGNFGGPLVDGVGQVVGVNTLSINQRPEAGPIRGLFFAIPSNTVRETVGQLIRVGYVAHPFFGVDIAPMTPAAASQYDLPVDYGVYVVATEPGGPAVAAGILEGDIITALAGQRIDLEHGFGELLFDLRPGESVQVMLIRDGLERQVAVTLGKQPRR